MSQNRTSLRRAVLAAAAMTVLATGAQAIPISDWNGKESSRRTYNTVTLDASPEDARRVLAAREVGKLAALLRAPGDTEIGRAHVGTPVTATSRMPSSA